MGFRHWNPSALLGFHVCSALGFCVCEDNWGKYKGTGLLKESRP